MFLGMLAHRLLTLGHIVATTKLPWKKSFRLKKKKEYDADTLLAKKGIAIIKEWQASYQVSFLIMYPYVYSSVIRIFCLKLLHSSIVFLILVLAGRRGNTYHGECSRR